MFKFSHKLNSECSVLTSRASHIHYLTLLSLHTITILPLSTDCTVYFMSEVHCTVLHLSTMLSHLYMYKCKGNYYKIVL